MSTADEKQIDFLQQYDPIGEAEKVVENILSVGSGKKQQVHYQDATPLDPDDPGSPTIGETVLGLSFGLMHKKRKAADALAEKTHDTMFSNKMDRYIEIVEDLGFEKCVEIDLERPKKRYPEDVQEKFYIYACEEDGLILSFDTYGGDSLNSGNLYYNILTYGPERRPQLSGGGGGPVTPYSLLTGKAFEINDRQALDEYYEDDSNPTVYPGSRDCREWLRRNVNRLRELELLPRWGRSPFLWFLGYTDTKCYECGEDPFRCECEVRFQYDHEAITKSRLAMSPVLQRIVNGTYEED